MTCRLVFPSQLNLHLQPALIFVFIFISNSIISDFTQNAWQFAKLGSFFSGPFLSCLARGLPEPSAEDWEAALTTVCGCAGERFDSEYPVLLAPLAIHSFIHLASWLLGFLAFGSQLAANVAINSLMDLLLAKWLMLTSLRALEVPINSENLTQFKLVWLQK